MAKKIIGFCVFVFLIFACQKDESTPENEGEIDLNLVISIPDVGGLNLKASFTGLKQSEITDSGFLVSSQSFPSFNNSSVVKSEINGNQFEGTISSDLIYNDEYYAVAFVKVGSANFYYSDVQSFVSLGSKPPEITEITLQAHLLDTISIYGKYFTEKTNNITVHFDDQISKIVVSNDTVIKCIVPETIKRFNPELKLKVYEKKVNNNSFSLFKPEIISVSTINATFRDELTITGNHFDVSTLRNKVFIGNAECSVIYSDRNSLKIIVPDDLESSSEEIKLVAQLQETLYGENFKLIPPEIHLVPDSVNANQEITIEGAYFHPVKDKNIVYFENVNADLLSGNTESLNVKVPLGPFPRRKALLKIQLLDITVEYDIDLNILDKWVMISNDLPLQYYGHIHNAVVANNNAYVLTNERGVFSDTKYLWKFIPEDFSWEKMNVPFDIDVYDEGGIVESDGVNIYVYIPNKENDFWEFNTVSSTWTKKASFTGNKRQGATHFSIDGDIYVGLGMDYEPYVPVSYNDFYKYNPQTNSWSQISSVPFTIYDGGSRMFTSTFVVNQKGYFMGGAISTGARDGWSYNPSSDVWNRIVDFNSAIRNTASFSLNGFGYVVGGSNVGGSNTKDCWQYNPSNDSWVQLDNVGHIERGRHFAFSLNGRAYVGGGGIYDSGGASGYDLYEFIP